MCTSKKWFQLRAAFREPVFEPVLTGYYQKRLSKGGIGKLMATARRRDGSMASIALLDE
jgi:hypothetical protein